MSFLFKKVAAQDGVPTKFVGICRNGAKYYTTATSFEQAKKELTEKAKNEGREVINVRVAEDAAEFKVGDKVKHTQYGTIGKVFEIDPAGNVGVQWNNGQAYYGKTAKPLSLIIAADSAAMDAITESDLKKHAHDFARYELGKYADELRKKRNSLADLWKKTSIAGGAIRSGEYKQADIDEFVNPYVNAIDDAIRILERI